MTELGEEFLYLGQDMELAKDTGILGPDVITCEHIEQRRRHRLVSAWKQAALPVLKEVRPLLMTGPAFPFTGIWALPPETQPDLAALLPAAHPPMDDAASFAGFLEWDVVRLQAGNMFFTLAREACEDIESFSTNAASESHIEGCIVQYQAARRKWLERQGGEARPDDMAAIARWGYGDEIAAELSSAYYGQFVHDYNWDVRRFIPTALRWAIQAMPRNKNPDYVASIVEFSLQSLAIYARHNEALVTEWIERGPGSAAEKRDQWRADPRQSLEPYLAKARREKEFLAAPAQILG